MDAYFHFCLVLLVLIFFAGSQVIGNDPCKRYQDIYDPYRSTKSRLRPGIRANCDFRLETGWYRFTSMVGGQIPTTKPKPFHCNTIAPIWMKGELPKTKGTQIDAIACINLFNLADGCMKKLPMSVKYCDGEGGEDFYIYKLSHPTGCAMAYCAGDKVPCPRGMTGIEPKCSVSQTVDFPTSLVPSPKVDYVRNKNSLAMSCKFDFPPWNNVSFSVEWLADGKIIRTQWLCGDDKGETCDRRNLESIVNYRVAFKMGQNLRCRLKMRYSTSPDNKWSVSKYSNIFYVGIEVTPRQIVVKECERNKDVKVNLRPTVPIHSNTLLPESDYLNVSILVPQKYAKQRKHVVVDTCSVQLKTQDISSGKYITIKGVCDELDEEEQKLNFHFSHESTYYPWAGYRPPGLLVRVDSTKTSICSATGDPHYKTFDGKYFDFYKAGDYLMYSNARKSVEVHVRLWTCNPGVSCNCGVAIRERNDIVVLSVCNDVLERGRHKITPITLKLRNKGRPLADGFYIARKSQGSSMEFIVLLPSGTRVKVSRSDWGMSVYINAPGTDKGQVSGLCGNFNGDPHDDLKGRDGKIYKNTDDDEQRFGSTWHIPREESYFESYPILIPPVNDGQSCTCPTENNKGKIGECKKTANRYVKVDGFEGIMKYFVTFDTVKRSVDRQWYSDDIIDHVDRSYFVDDPHVQHALHRIRSKRSPRVVMSKNEATKFCREHIEETTAGRTCRDVSGVNIKLAVRQCITDLELTGDTAYAYSAFDFMAYECKDATFKNISLYDKSPDGDLIPPTKIVEDLCPADCSGHGKCKNRTCICDKGFTARDCSMDVNAVPEVLGIYNGGLCDLRERPCRKTNLLGQNFISSGNLTCHVEEMEVYPGSWSPRGSPIKMHGDMYDLYGVKCDLPEPPTKLGDYDHEGTPAGGLLISVSNDGFNTSVQKLRHLSFDSKCLNCSNLSNCELKVNSCLIRGHCFAVNEPNPRDWCHQCQPVNNQTSWTRRKNNQAPKFSSKSKYKALRGEDLVIQLRATDPDNRPVKYSVLNSTATGYTFSPTGLLRGKVTSNDKFTFKVTDECGAFDTIDIGVRIVQCPCMNGGRCVPHPEHPRGSGLYQCQCLKEFSGDRCEICKGIIDNKAPKFITEANIFALQGEDLLIQLKAEDPEKLNVTYSVLRSSATGYTLSPSGLLRWNVASNNENQTLTIKFADECDAFDTIDMTLRIIPCPCFNGGKCVPHPNHSQGSGKYKCNCVNRFRGEHCERCPGFVCPPRNVTVKAVGSTKLEVNWLGPSDNFLSYYSVKYSQPKYRYRWEQVPKTTTSWTLANLRKFTDYRVAVSVVNAYGEKMVEVMTKTGEDVPDAAPVITGITPERYDTTRVEWSAIPESKRNGIIRGYKIYYRELYTEDEWNVRTTPTGDLTSTMVTGLRSYTEYCMKMSAFTSKGEYPDWKRKQCYTVKTPSLPINVSGEAMSRSEILLRFEKPKHSTSSNRVQVDYGKQKDLLNMKKACYGSSCVIDNLEEDTMYYFRVIGYIYQKGETPSFTTIRTLAQG